jgi:hypothetical protein
VKKIGYLILVFSLICQYFNSSPVVEAEVLSYEGNIQVLGTNLFQAFEVKVGGYSEKRNSSLSVSNKFNFQNCASIFSDQGVNMVLQQSIFSLNQSAGCVTWSEGSKVVEGGSGAVLKVVSQPTNNFASIKVLKESFEKAFPGAPINSIPTAFFVQGVLFASMLTMTNFLKQRESLKKKFLIFKQPPFLTFQNMRC